MHVKICGWLLVLSVVDTVVVIYRQRAFLSSCESVQKVKCLSWIERKIPRDHALSTDLVGELVMVNNSRAAAGYSRAHLNDQCV